MQNFTKTDLEGAETLWRSVTNHPHDMLIDSNNDIVQS